MSDIVIQDESSRSEGEDFTITGGDGLDDDIRARLIEVIRKGRESAANPELYGDREDTFVVALRKIKDHLSIAEDAKFIYPGSATHVGVARVFGAESVTHVDPDTDACRALSAAGYLVAHTGIEDFHPPEQFDGIVALNSYGVPRREMITEIVKPGGVIIANNYTHWAAKLAEMEELKLITAFGPAYYSEDARMYEGPDIPTDATSLGALYIKIEDGVVSYGSPDDYTFAEDTPKYPDALFVFRLSERTTVQ